MMKAFATKLKLVLFTLIFVFSSLLFQAPAHAALEDLNENMWVTNGGVESIIDDGNGTVYLGGNFTHVGPSTGYGAAIDTSSGSPDLTLPKVNDTINAVIPDGSGGWYIGGSFTQVGTETRNYIAHILPDKTVDPNFNPNASSTVLSLALSGSTLYAGGYFTSIGGQNRNRLAAIDTTTGLATDFNPNASNIVFSLALSGSTLYAGGYFTSIGGQNRNRLAAIDTTTGLATDFNPNASSYIRSLLLSGSTLYAGGDFTTIGGQSRNRLAALDTTTGLATDFNPNANSTVYSLALSGSTLYAGGYFTSIGGQSRNRLAAIDTTTGLATSFNPNANSYVYSLALSGSTLYAGGDFTTIGGQNRNYLAALDTTTGLATSFNPNANSYVYSLALSGSTLYAGGDFTSIGGQPQSFFAAFTFDSTPPDLSLSPLSPDLTSDNTPSIGGSATDTDGTVSSVDYQMEGLGGAWSSCTATDGTFDEATEAFTCTVSPALADGEHTIYVRATDSNGNTTASGSEATDTFEIDASAPAADSPSAVTSKNGATISWATDEQASSQIEYGLTGLYGTTTPEANTSPRVADHEVALSGLLSCTTYHYRTISKDEANNTTTGEDQTFTTSGCTGESLVVSQSTSTLVSVSGSSLSLLDDSNKGVGLTVPKNFSSQEAVFQIKKLESSPVIQIAGTPSGLSLVGSFLFNFQAYTDLETELASFLAPLTITFSYASSDIGNTNEDTLAIYRWTGSSWNVLSDIVVNKTNETVSGTTTSFSDFGLFGEEENEEDEGEFQAEIPFSPGPPGPPTCSDAKPVSAPDLFQIDLIGSTAKLFFTPIANTQTFYVSFSINTSAEEHGEMVILLREGVQSHTIYHLIPNTSYYFKVRGQNGCMPGDWSAILKAKTGWTNFLTKYYRYSAHPL